MAVVSRAASESAVEYFLNRKNHISPNESVRDCKVAIPRETGRSYGIRWGSGMRVSGETKVTDGRKDERTDGRTGG